MKILVLAWEFPPRIVGGIARHVAEIYPEVVEQGHEVHVLTVEFGQAPAYEVVDGVHVHRVAVAESHNFFEWVGHMNLSMGRYGGQLLLKEGPFDLIHAHDWLVGDAAIALRDHFRLPLVTTIHATEYGRHGGLFNDVNRYVDSQEKALIHRSWRVVVCTDYMRREVSQIHNYPAQNIDVIFNGIRSEKKQFAPSGDHASCRRRYAGDDEKVIYYVGRMTYEKGLAVLLNAMPKVIRGLAPRPRLVVIGGGNVEHLKQQALALNIADYCTFTGFMADRELDRFQTIADCAVFPSLYEPFGIVALESFAARVPVVVSNAGGLPEVVLHRETGIVTDRNNPDSLAEGILSVLKEEVDTHRLVQRAFADLERRFSWPKLAKQTVSVYSRILNQFQESLAS
jgi:glycosyltransferase involved in cell wall biosynthesis